MPPAVFAAPCVFSVDGTDIPALGAALLELDVAGEEGRPSRCTAAFGAPLTGSDFIDRRQLDFGRRFKVSRSGATLFDGVIVALGVRVTPAGPPLVQVVAEDALQRLADVRRTRTFTDLSDGDIMQRVAADHGLQAIPELSGPTYASVSQLAMSDLDFLGERLRRLDAWMWADGTTLRARLRRIRPSGAFMATSGQNLREFAATADLRGQPTALSSAGWDVRSKTGIAATATVSALGAEGQGGDTAAAIVLQRSGERRDADAAPIASTGSEADALAQAAYRRGARRFVTGRGVADLDGRITAGATVTLQRLGASFSGAYLVTAMRHRYDARDGYRTEFTAERPVLGRP
jgi:Bacteriophage probable baseplate hub protein